VISASHLTRRFGNREVVHDVSFDVGRAEIVALLGPNGAGKTTMMRMLAGLIAPTSGAVVIDGVPWTRTGASALRQKIGFLPEAPGLWDRLTVRENLATYAALYELDRPHVVIDRLVEFFDLTKHQKARAAELSKGTRQKVALARTLLHDPKILILDEPTSGLDPEVTRDVRRLLDERRRHGCAILVSTHNLDEAERLADRVAVLQQRLLAIDTPASLRRRLIGWSIGIKVAGSAADYLSLVRPFDPGATAAGPIMTVRLSDPERETPALVRALVNAGAAVVEVRPEMMPLEDVYLHLIAPRATTSMGSPS
jgi:ABC-2 type transport system ATP-binding protein